MGSVAYGSLWGMGYELYLKAKRAQSTAGASSRLKGPKARPQSEATSPLIPFPSFVSSL